MIDHFSIEQFDQVVKNVRPASYHAGVIMGEHIWYVPLDEQCQIVVRSSIRPNGTSADSGDDSIRLFLSDKNEHVHLGKLDAYTTRVSGWEKRIEIKISYLASLRLAAGDCKRCENPLHIFIVQKEGANKGRPFATCKHCSGDKLSLIHI